jgi:hypothetical protein
MDRSTYQIQGTLFFHLWSIMVVSFFWNVAAPMLVRQWLRLNAPLQVAGVGQPLTLQVLAFLCCGCENDYVELDCKLVPWPVPAGSMSTSSDCVVTGLLHPLSANESLERSVLDASMGDSNAICVPSSFGTKGDTDGSPIGSCRTAETKSC